MTADQIKERMKVSHFILLRQTTLPTLICHGFIERVHFDPLHRLMAGADRLVRRWSVKGSRPSQRSVQNTPQVPALPPMNLRLIATRKPGSRGIALATRLLGRAILVSCDPASGSSAAVSKRRSMPRMKGNPISQQLVFTRYPKRQFGQASVPG